MARAKTANFEQFVLEVEFDPDGSPGVYSRMCGITDASIDRSTSVDSSEVPDCDDESLPMTVEKAVRSREVSLSGTGVWALQSHNKMLNWWRSGARKAVRLRHVRVEADGEEGDIIAEEGLGLLTSLRNDRAKGTKVTASIEIMIDGEMDITEKPAA